VLPQGVEWDDVERSLVRRGEHDGRGNTVVEGAQPVGGRDAPPVTRD
jgi:hypothetical protein